MTHGKDGDPAERLGSEADRFAHLLTRLLNGTVTSNVEVTSYLWTQEARTVAIVAPGAVPRGRELASPEGRLVPLSTSGLDEDAVLWLGQWFRLVLDEENRYLGVVNSSLRLVVDPRTRRSVMRIEFDRDKFRHPQAHVHVHGVSGELAYAQAATGQPLRDLEKLHIPVGGLRYRPSLEDFIEFLVLEGFATPRAGWQELLDASRHEYHQLQLRAAMRRDPETARAAALDLGLFGEE